MNKSVIVLPVTMVQVHNFTVWLDFGGCCNRVVPSHTHFALNSRSCLPRVIPWNLTIANRLGGYEGLSNELYSQHLAPMPAIVS
jgi:hypothetical protein